MQVESERWLPDFDGHFVREFQTSGFSARMWELYLWAALRSLHFDIDYGLALLPDFALDKDDQPLVVEATTVSTKDATLNIRWRRSLAQGRQFTSMECASFLKRYAAHDEPSRELP